MTKSWRDLSRFLEEQHWPKGWERLGEADWVEHLVRRMMDGVARQQAQEAEERGEKYKLTESSHSLMVQIPLPENVTRSKLKLLVSELKLRITGLPSGKSLVVQLSKPVRPNQCRAYVDEGILYVKLRKRSSSRKFYKGDIDWD